MKILLTNDDGINVKGLTTLRESIKEIADVIVVAPETERVLWDTPLLYPTL